MDSFACLNECLYANSAVVIHFGFTAGASICVVLLSSGFRIKRFKLPKVHANFLF
jgi:hypothetical protein